LKSTLRILSQGADANYRNPEDGNQCVHAAVVAGELGQIELLCLYGADVAALDRNGLTSSEIARMHHPTQPHIADRLVELQFELTDELSYFLASKRPDHRNARHFLIPDIEKYQSLIFYLI
jgi:ankyrin repeat protein